MKYWVVNMKEKELKARLRILKDNKNKLRAEVRIIGNGGFNNSY